LAAKAAATLTAAERARLDWHRADMASADLGRRFARVICPYSAFTYLVEPERRARALDGVRRHLAADGRFVLDVFVPDRGIEALPDGHVHLDYRRELADGTVLERTKTIRRAERDVNVIERHYTLRDGSGAVRRRIDTVDRIRVYRPEELRRVLEAHGFRIVEELPDFRPGPWTERTKMAALVAVAA
ncbi:MAG TPA: hypothetical protein VK669_08885, partial [Candidatus Limnocylindrales bacterium]|nr:hypothetical protein [Candidatus Limnocylindrales bacterium]